MWTLEPDSLARILTRPLTKCVALGKLLNFSVPQLICNARVIIVRIKRINIYKMLTEWLEGRPLINFKQKNDIRFVFVKKVSAAR